jgi:hypothetical protein
MAARRGYRSISYSTNDPQARPLLRRNLFFERGQFPLITRAPDPGIRTLAKGDMIIQGGDMD